MKYRKLLQLLISLVGIFIGMMLFKLAAAAQDQQPQQDISFYNTDVGSLLDWVPSNTNICHGSFANPNELTRGVNAPDMSRLPSQISAAGPTLFSRNGPSILLNDVVYSQPGRTATANRAVIYRDEKTGRLQLIHLSGNVHLIENGKLMVGPYGDLNLATGTASFGPTAYHLLETPDNFHSFTQTYNGWGRAQKTERHANGVLDLYHASYSTCAPEAHPPWQLTATHVRLDHDNAKGSVYNALLRVKGVPVFYLPYYTFPLNSDRKSGMLIPFFDYSGSSGFGMRLPYYWNIAPNYDMTLTPRIMSKRGVQLNSLLRYLNHKSYNELYASFIPDDAAFATFRSDILENPPDIGKVNPQPYLDELQGDSNNRAYVSLLDDIHFTPDWSAHVIGNYVSDAYYFKDFGAVYGTVSNNQLLNQADIDYNGNHWNFIGMAQGFQTLHMIDNAGNDARSQYIRLPEVDFNADYPNLWQGVVSQLSGQSVDFLYSSDFVPVTTQLPVGERLHVLPTISRPFNWAFGYVTPQVGVDSTTYDAENDIVSPETSRPDVNASRNLPLADIDSGLYFQRYWDVGTDGYMQTLEPRLMYLYVPYQNQDQYPVFDTQLLNFSYDQLFSLNRFSSVDRIENANQVSMGMTSRFLDAANSFEKLQLDLGVIRYFTPPKVCLDPQNCQDSTYNVIPLDSQWSPIVSQLTYDFLPRWSTTTAYAWNPETEATDNGKWSLNYHRDQRHVFNFGYQYIATTGASEDNYGLSNNTNYVFTGVGWPLSTKWTALSYAYYNFSKARVDHELAGLQYDTCCWALRFVMQRDWISSTQPSGTDVVDNTFDTVYAVQIELKSLGSVGSGSAQGAIKRDVPGFANPFVR